MKDDTEEFNEIEDEFEDDEDDEYYPFDEDDWEDSKKIDEYKAKYPGWYIMKVTNYQAIRLGQIDKWCREYCQSEFKKIEWRSGCSYSVAVGFENYQDAILYKLRWL